MQGFETSGDQDEGEYDDSSREFEVCAILKDRINDLPKVHYITISS